MTEQVVRGRGAWPALGIGGTLNAKGTAPGPFYALAQDPLKQIGLKTWCLKQQGEAVKFDYDAVHHGVTAIQALLVGQGHEIENPVGIFDASTQTAVMQHQRKRSLVVDGVVGMKTMESLLTPLIIDSAGKHNVPWQAIYGILRYESAWDPGAVGVISPADWGLAQINTTVHPVTMGQAFCSSFAVNFIGEYFAGAMSAFGDIKDAVVSYNLGHAGTRQWIEAGRPSEWTPRGASTPRNPNAYAERILNAAA